MIAKPLTDGLKKTKVSPECSEAYDQKKRESTTITRINFWEFRGNAISKRSGPCVRKTALRDDPRKSHRIRGP